MATSTDLEQAAQDKLVYFVHGENAEGRVIAVEDDGYDSDRILELSVWRWAEDPQQVLLLVPEDGYGEHWLPAAYAAKGQLRPDTTQLQAELEDQKIDGGYFDEWDPVTALQNAGAVDGYTLGQQATDLLGIERVPQAWYDELERQREAENAADREERRARLLAREAVYHACKDEAAVACSLDGARVVYSTVETSRGACTACGNDADTRSKLERLDNGGRTGVLVCEDCWGKMARAAGVYQRYSNSGYFFSFGVLPEGAVPENCCALAR